MPRRTLSTATPKLQGIGLHTGAPGWVRLLPLTGNSISDSAHGLVFQSSLTGETFSVSPQLISDTRRCTALQLGGQRLSTVEHLLAAITGCGISDAIIEFDGSEVPILDGSAREFVFAIESAGTHDFDFGEGIIPLQPQQPIVAAGEHGERLVALPSDSFSLTVVLDYPGQSAIGTQAARYQAGLTCFPVEIAPARTYGFLSEFEKVRSLGLATGASFENCIALNDDGTADERTPLRFQNELARHKLLDVLGDLTLAARPIVAEIIAVRPSHAVNCLLAARLASDADG